MQLKISTLKTTGLQIIPMTTKQVKKSIQLFKGTGFTGKKNQIITFDGNMYVGINGIKKDKDDWRILATKIVNKLISYKVREASISLKSTDHEFLEGLVLGAYKFDKYKSKKDKIKLKTIYILTDEKDIIQMQHSIVTAKMAAEATNLTRDWVNTTPEDANSKTIAKAVKQEFEGTDVVVEVYDEKYLKKQGMNAHLAVNRASRHKAKTIKLTHTPHGWNEQEDEHHIFVGKGLTYDSGGLSLKPGNHMTTMKADKAGAMTLFGFMKYISVFGSPHKITAYLGIAENMVDGTAYKPDDVLTAMNGKTIHVKNTDAEGRLVLFDNLCLAQKQNKKFTTLHSLATLTGAAVYCFGDEAAALVGFNNKLKKQVQKAGKEAGEIFMNAEFHKYMMDGVDDSLADLSNTGTAGMGCQKAGLFLTNALESKNKKKYIHWDIAGPAFVEKTWGHNPEGASGFGVRTLINLTK